MLVTLEGPDGAGKTTLAEGLADRLRRSGRTAVVTQEPGGGPIGPVVRQALLEGGEVPPLAELFLFLADRADHVARVVRPALDRGEVVVCDRFSDSTVVYQGHCRGLPLEELRRLNAMATGGLVPGLTILLDLPAELVTGRAQGGDRFDREDVGFHQKVRQGFLFESRLDPGRWAVLDATLDRETLLGTAWLRLEARLAAGSVL